MERRVIKVLMLDRRCALEEALASLSTFPLNTLE